VVVYFWTATKRRSRGALWSIIAPPFTFDDPNADPTTESLRKEYIADISQEPAVLVALSKSGTVFLFSDHLRPFAQQLKVANRRC
jgi:hypothetical protein